MSSKEEEKKKLERKVKRKGIEWSDHEGNSLLHQVCRSPQVSLPLIELLLQHKAQPNQPNDTKETPLQLLCQNEKVELPLLRLLVDNKADPHLLDNRARSMLHLLCQNKNLSLELIRYAVEELQLDLNAHDREKYVNPPFIKALANEKLDLPLLRYLVEHKADLQYQNEDNMTALHILCTNYEAMSLEMLKILAEQPGVDPSLKDFYGCSPFENAMRHPHLTIEMLRYIVDERGFDVTEKSQNSFTSLHFVCECNENKEEKLELMRWLIDNKVDATHKNRDDETALHSLCSSFYVGVPMIECWRTSASWANLATMEPRCSTCVA